MVLSVFSILFKANTKQDSVCLFLELNTTGLTNLSEEQFHFEKKVF